MAEDLENVGIPVKVDLKSGNSETNFATAILDWHKESDFVLLLGSPSYSSRAKDKSTLLFKESQLLTEKRVKQGDSVLPLLMAGNYVNAFPPGYKDTTGAKICTAEQYFQNFPDIVSVFLSIHQDKDTIARISEFKKEIELIGERMKKSSQRQDLQYASYKAKVLICKSKFTDVQLDLLDGQISENARSIQAYCEAVTRECVDTLPGDVGLAFTRGNSAPDLENKLVEFLHGEEEVLLLQSPLPLGSQVCRYAAGRALRELKMVPVFIHLDQLDDPTAEDCVQQSLRSVYSLDDAAILQAQQRCKFLLLVHGFDECHIETNLYVHNMLFKWAGKTIFTCSSSYISKSPQAAFYFMPCRENLQPKPQGLKILQLFSRTGNTSSSTLHSSAGSISMLPLFFSLY